jgi:hypothetical protein
MLMLLLLMLLLMLLMLLLLMLLLLMLMLIPQSSGDEVKGWWPPHCLLAQGARGAALEPSVNAGGMVAVLQAEKENRKKQAACTLCGSWCRLGCSCQ